MYSAVEGGQPKRRHFKRAVFDRLSGPGRKPEECGFYMPSSPYAQKANEFVTDKVQCDLQKLVAPAHHKDLDVVTTHHAGRR